MHPYISIIVPVYNAEAYLHRCMESVTTQTHKSVEIICVNDASSDASSEILHQYAARDRRIKVIDLPHNVGESAARNIGISEACGEYIGSVDNDDAIDQTFFELLYREAVESNSDITKGNCIEILSNTGERVLRYINNFVRCNKFYFSHQWWTAIYRRTLIQDNNIVFPETLCLGGDIVFLLKALIYSNNVTTLDDIFYYHYKRDDSGDSKVLSTRKLDSLLAAHEQIFTILNDAHPSHITTEEYDAFYSGHYKNIANNVPARCEEAKDREKCVNAVKDFYYMCKNPDVLTRSKRRSMLTMRLLN